MKDIRGVGKVPGVAQDRHPSHKWRKYATPGKQRPIPKGVFGGHGGLLVSLLALAKPSIQNALNEYLGLNEVEYWRNPEGSSYEQSLGFEPQSLDYLPPLNGRISPEEAEALMDSTYDEPMLDAQQRALYDRLEDTTRPPYTSEPRGDRSTNPLLQGSLALDSLMKVMYPMIFGGGVGKATDAMEKIENENTLKQYLEKTLYKPPPVY